MDRDEFWRQMDEWQNDPNHGYWLPPDLSAEVCSAFDKGWIVTEVVGAWHEEGNGERWEDDSINVPRA